MTLRRLPLLLVALAMGAAACSVLPSEKIAVAPVAKTGATAGGTITVGITPPGGIDPVNAYEPVGKLISSTMCDTVVTLDPETGHVREGLAKSIVYSPDGTTLTFKMRRGLTFNDGTKFNPRDADFSFQLLSARSTASYVRQLIAPFATGIAAAVGGDGQQDSSILAEDEIGDAQPIAQAKNEADFQMFATTGNGGAVRVLGEPALALISRRAYLADPLAFARMPVCIGPYKLAKPYASGDRQLVLVRTPGYHAANVGYTGGGRGYADSIVFKIFATAEQAYDAYGRGEVDVVAVPPSRARAAARFGAALVTGRETALEFLGLPTGLDPFNSTDLRRALSLALDRSALAATLGGGAAPANGFLPSALEIKPGANGIRTGSAQSKDSKGVAFDGCGGAIGTARDVEGARRALAKAKQAQAVAEALAKPVKFYVNTDGPYVAMVEQAAAQWKSVLGITVEVTRLRWADYVQKATQGPGFDGPFRMAWSTVGSAPEPMYNDAQAFLKPLFTTTGSSNWSHFSSTEFDFAFAEDAARATDVRERGVFFRRLESMLCADVPMIPVAAVRPQYLVRVQSLASARPSYLAAASGLPLLRELYRR